MEAVFHLAWIKAHGHFIARLNAVINKPGTQYTPKLIIVMFLALRWASFTIQNDELCPMGRRRSSKAPIVIVGKI